VPRLEVLLAVALVDVALGGRMCLRVGGVRVLTGMSRRMRRRRRRKKKKKKKKNKRRRKRRRR